MHIVIFILGVICVLGGLLLFLAETGSEKTGGAICLLAGIGLLILGSDLSQHLRTFKLSGTSVEVSFSQEPAVLTPQQVAGAQKAQQIRLAPSRQAPPQQTTATTGARLLDWSAILAEASRRHQEKLDTLHQALRNEGYTSAPDPSTDLSPGTVVRIAQDGGVTVYLKQKDAFPQLNIQSSNFDFRQFTSLGGKPGFTEMGSFDCQQGFREKITFLPNAATPIPPVVDAALKSDSNLHVVLSVLGCYGKDTTFRVTTLHPSPVQPDSSAPLKRYTLGFQTTTLLR